MDSSDKIIKLLEVCARELTINNQLKMVEDARDGAFNGDLEFNSLMLNIIAEDAKIIRSIVEEDTLSDRSIKNGGSDNV